MQYALDNEKHKLKINYIFVKIIHLSIYFSFLNCFFSCVIIA